MEKGMHAMAMKPVFKDIQKNRPLTYEELVSRFNARTVDMTVAYHYINDVLHVTTDTNWSSQEEPLEDMATDGSICSSMPSLVLHENETDSSDDDSNIDSIVDVTKLYKTREMEDEWSETMEELNIDIDNVLADYMEYGFNLANSQQAFPGSM